MPKKTPTTTTNFQPLFEYLDEMKADIDTRFNKLEQKVDSITSTLDYLCKTVKGFEQEMIVNRHRIERLEDWAKQVSAKTGIPIPF